MGGVEPALSPRGDNSGWSDDICWYNSGGSSACDDSYADARRLCSCHTQASQLGSSTTPPQPLQFEYGSKGSNQCPAAYTVTEQSRCEDAAQKLAGNLGFGGAASWTSLPG